MRPKAVIYNAKLTIFLKYQQRRSKTYQLINNYLFLLKFGFSIWSQTSVRYTFANHEKCLSDN
ncbi:hypothetical protein Slin_5615 [Spirosoma linguale DSM 74]|uniref:Uncharacterized protein n=1 Tax=Spirosoma linguale (strain ATCC 33905 / DSM 74 / LMG 10896 / Claus 1) TaxID=504472 RepID=D2QRZ8_SPILD|nr:hypothetical protein Slin_5615 [Spirosoma linguale DSM 74]